MTEPKKPQLTYAYITRRGLAFFIDMLICSLLAAGIGVAISSIGISSTLPSWIYFTVIACYFIGLTSQRFNATLGMRVSGLRVIRIDGENQHIWQAVFHTASKFVTLYAIISIAPASVKNEDLIIAIIGCFLLLIPVFHPRKQALHNILLGTLVLYGDSKSNSDGKHLVAEEPNRWERASIVRSSGELLFLLFFLGILHVGFSAIHDRNLISRTIYALNKTHDLKIQIEEFYLQYEHFPENDAEFGSIPQISFPDGGGARLEKDGVIRIWFDVLPELKNGNIWLSPDKPNDNQAMQWACTSNNIKKYWLPRTCRY